MKKIIVYLLSFLIIWINTTFAESTFTKAPVIIKSEPTSLEISWEKLDSASGYFIYYSEVSWKDYRTFWDIIEENKTIITWLKENTKYYVVVTALDKVTEEESIFSPEWIFNTTSLNETKFALNKVETKSPTELELTFSKNIDQSEEALREFKITKDNKEITKVKEVKLVENDKTKLTLILSNPIATWEYKIVVISIRDEDWKNIEEWINWELKFMVSDFSNTTTETTTTTETATVDNNTPLISAEEKIVDLNAWSPETNDQYYGLAWKNMTGVLSTWEVVANDSTKLPQTWPESIFVLFASLILGSLFYFRKRKTV